MTHLRYGTVLTRGQDYISTPALQALLGRATEGEYQNNERQQPRENYFYSHYISLYILLHLPNMFSRSLTRGVGATMRNVQVRQRNGDEETRNMGLTDSSKLGPTLHSSLLNPPLRSRRRRVLT